MLSASILQICRALTDYYNVSAIWVCVLFLKQCISKISISRAIWHTYAGDRCKTTTTNIYNHACVNIVRCNRKQKRAFF